jgi:ABC-type glycerol-3-phosphate transport system substrate-binding protein
MKTLTQPQPLSTFKDQLLQSGDIQKLIAEEYGPEADAAIGRFRAGEDGDLWDLIEDNKQEISGSPVEVIDAAAPDDDIFGIEIWSTGPVFWIRANEFDDIGYFPSLPEARAYAEVEFESLIAELSEREEEE